MRCIGLIVILIVLSFSSLSFAQETKLNGMNFINPFRGDSAFISNHFGLSQNFNSTGFGEAVDAELKFHDYLGIFGKFDAGFGLDASQSNLKFSIDDSIFAQEGIAIRIVRVEQLGSQLGFRIKIQQVRSGFVGFDSSKIDVDGDYFKSLKGQKEVDPEEIAIHIKGDIKNNVDAATYSGKYSSFSSGVSFNLATAYNKNFASQISVGILYGSAIEEQIISEQQKYISSEKLRETSLNLSMLGSLRPLIPIVMQTEYQYDIGLKGSSTHTVLGSIFYNTKDNFSVGVGVGKVFADRSSIIGNLSGRYYFY